MKFIKKHISSVIKIILIIALLLFAFKFRFKENHLVEYISYGVAIIALLFPNIDKIKNLFFLGNKQSKPRIDWRYQRDYDFFIGREFYINELLGFFYSESDNAYALLLYAAGGVGKTALSRHLVDILKQKGLYTDEEIVWLKNRDSRYDPNLDEFELLPPVYPTYESLIIDVARILNIEGGSTSDISRCEKGIRSIFTKSKLLLILDGIEDSQKSNEIVTRFLQLFSNESKTKILITSRQNIKLIYGKSLKLDPFTFEETKMFITQFIKQQDVINRNLSSQGSNVEREIHSVTEGNPLTLKVFLSHLVFSSYYDLIQRAKERNFEGLNQYLYSAAWNRLKAQNSLALKILFLLAERRNQKGLYAENIGIALNQHLGEIEKSLNKLYEVSMIEIEPDKNSQVIKLHSNIRSFVLSKLE